MTEFISARQRLDDNEEDDEYNFDGINDYGKGKSGLTEKDIKDTLFPRDQFKSYLTVRPRGGKILSKSQSSGLLPGSKSEHVFIETLPDYQSKILNELYVVHTFILTNEEDTNDETERRLVTDVLSRLKEELEKLIFMKPKPTY